VKYFGGEEHEGARYRAAVQEYQALEYKVISMSNLAFLRFISFTLYLYSLFEPPELGSEFYNRNCQP